MTAIAEVHEKRRPHNSTGPDTAPVFLNMHQVRSRIGVGEMTIRRMVEQVRFPRPVRLTQQRVAWRKVDLEAWEASRAEVA